MAIRWRENGDLVCAAMSKAASNDTYIDDRLHHQLIVMKTILADIDHEVNGLWYWTHGDVFLRARVEI